MLSHDRAADRDTPRWARLAALACSAAVLAAPLFTPPPAKAAPVPAPPARPAPVRSFLQIRGDLWRASNGNWWTLVYNTPDGLLLVDTINTDYAAWLKGGLARRFPG